MDVRSTSVLVMTLGCLTAWQAHANPVYEQARHSTGNTVMVGAFSQGKVENWDTHGFNGETRYRLINDGGRQILHARCDDSASGLIREQRVDLEQTPILRWSWRVENVYEEIDETTREGDDYPASVYVGVKTGLTWLSNKVIHYVWSSNQPQGSSWDSAFTDKVKQVAVRSGLPGDNGWRYEARNVKEDFKRYFGLDVDHIDSVSLMSDCDNTDSRAEAYYGDILFTRQPDSRLTLEAPEHRER